MKITKSDLQEIIKEEAVRLFKIQKLEEAQIKVQKELKLISEGKKQMSDEELNELLAGLKSVFAAGAQKAGQAVAGAAQKIGQAVAGAGDKAKEVGGKIATKYKEGETASKKVKLEKQRDEIVAKIKELANEYKTITGKRYSMIGQKIDAVKM
jgi:ElaB/YqjD/DUF883 family membrane-anchored ribosome-binding protein